MKNKKLDELVKLNCLKSYTYVTLDAIDNEIDSLTDAYRGTERLVLTRCTEKLVLTFPDGQELKLDTWCSGSSENTSIIIR